MCPPKAKNKRRRRRKTESDVQTGKFDKTAEACFIGGREKALLACEGRDCDVIKLLKAAQLDVVSLVGILYIILRERKKYVAKVSR